MATLQRVSESSGLTSINPSTGEVIAHCEYHTAQEIDARLTSAHRGFEQWRKLEVMQRADILKAMASVLRAHQKDYSTIITQEMGKLLSESQAEIEKCAFLCEWMAEHGPAYLADEAAPLPNATAYISFLPLGPVLGVMPWNFPFWQAMRAAVPILLGGNGFVLKHAHNVTRCAMAMEEAWQKAGLPEGVVTHLRIASADISAVIADARISAVTLTGSGQAGSAVAAAAGKACKKSLLELGGADPFIVLADADIDRAVEAGIKARFGNAGQVCIAAKRFLLEAPIAEQFTEKFVASARALKAGDPTVSTTSLAPLARGDLRDTLHRQVEKTIAQGATLLCGGKAIAGKGYFYEPTVLGDVAPGMVAFDEETFGPVAALTKVANVEEAIALANRSTYGLSGNLWTRNTEQARSIARRLETGAVFINGFSASDPRIPIGGIKESGYGRELSHFGLREFVNAQTVVIR